MPADEMKLPSAGLFCSGRIPGPLSADEREWLVEQLHRWPNRVNEERTCAIGALTDIATAEFCRLMAERQSQAKEIEARDAALAWAESYDPELVAQIRARTALEGKG